MPEFFFQRYVNGERMADDVLITKQATLEDAIPAALRLCRNSPKSVLVHIPQTPWRDIKSAPRDGQSEIERLRAELAAVTKERDRMREVVKRADSYIHNGIELGFIRHCDTPEDPAYHTPRIVREAARAALEGVTEPQQSGAGNEQ